MEGSHLQKQENKPDIDKEDVGTWGREDQGRWRENGGKDYDPWKVWKTKGDASKEDEKWVNEDGKWNEKVKNGTNGWEEKGQRTWWGGGGIDRSLEMVARGFKRNTY